MVVGDQTISSLLFCYSQIEGTFRLDADFARGAFLAAAILNLCPYFLAFSCVWGRQSVSLGPVTPVVCPFFAQPAEAMLRRVSCCPFGREL